MKLAMKTEPNEAKLDIIAECGYEAVEVYLAKRFVKPEYIDMLNRYPFKYSAHSPVKYCDESIFDFAKGIGAETVTVHCTYTEDELEDMSLRAACLGLTLCLENEGVWGEDNYEHDLNKPPELYTVREGYDFLKIVQKATELCMTFDTEHSGMRSRTETFWPLVEAGYVRHMHTSGYDGTRGSWHSPPTNNPARFRDIILKLQELEYDGFLTVEMHMPFHTKSIIQEQKKFFDEVA